MITKHQLPNGTCFTVDTDELAQWIKDHPSKLCDQPISTKIDNYGTGGNKAASRRRDNFGVKLRLERGGQ